MSAVGGRIHAPVLTAAAGEPRDGRCELFVPAVGWWRQQVAAGQVVQSGDVLGELTVLGVVYRVVAGPGVRGAVVAGPARAAVAIDGARALLAVEESLAPIGAAAGEHAPAAAAGGGLVVRAPSSGRFYGKPGPGKAPFVAVGDVIEEGHTVCLLEIMKTFHRVTYGGAGLPPRARVTAIAVADEADINGGDVLLHLEGVSV